MPFRMPEARDDAETGSRNAPRRPSGRHRTSADSPPADPPTPKTVIGWREYVALPEWGVDHIKTKVDTGARTSAIDVVNVTEIEGERVRFEIVVSRGESGRQVVVEAPIVRRTRVKSSFGARHDRLIVRTRIRVGAIEREVDLSLVSRRNMLCRMLLGRKALEPDLIVDPSRRYLHGRRPRRPAGKKRGGA